MLNKSAHFYQQIKYILWPGLLVTSLRLLKKKIKTKRFSVRKLFNNGFSNIYSPCIKCNEITTHHTDVENKINDPIMKIQFCQKMTESTVLDPFVRCCKSVLTNQNKRVWFTCNHWTGKKLKIERKIPLRPPILS